MFLLDVDREINLCVILNENNLVDINEDAHIPE